MKFEAILDIQLVSVNEDNLYQNAYYEDFFDREYKVVAACLGKIGHNTFGKVTIIDFNDPEENFQRFIRFKNEVSLDNVIAKISNDMSNVIVGNNEEIYTLKNFTPVDEEGNFLETEFEQNVVPSL